MLDVHNLRAISMKNDENAISSIQKPIHIKKGLSMAKGLLADTVIILSPYLKRYRIVRL